MSTTIRHRLGFGLLILGLAMIYPVPLAGLATAVAGLVLLVGSKPDSSSRAGTSTVPRTSSADAIDIGDASEGFWFDIVGESQYQGTLRRIDGGRLEREEDVEVTCLIVPEPENAYDANALAVYVENAGKVGYFSRDDAASRMGPLRAKLMREGVVGTCPGRLTGGWDETVSIGVRLAMRRPSSFRPPERTAMPEGAAVEESTLPRILTVSLADWAARPVVQLPAGKAWMKLVEERLCQPEIGKLVAGRSVVDETVSFEVALVPDNGSVIVWAIGAGPVGRMGRSDVVRHTELFTHLERTGSIGTCYARVVKEADAFGLMISIKAPKAIMKLMATPGA